MVNKILKYGYYIFFGALIFVALVVVASAFPIQGNIQIKVVQSGSMEPAIKTGSVVIIKPLSTSSLPGPEGPSGPRTAGQAANYKIGDVITFEGNFKDAKGKKIPISHRIVEMKVEGSQPIYITKGDANEERDSKEVLQNQVICKVYLIIPYLGYAIETARTTYGFLALIIIPAAIIIYDQSVKVFKELKRIYGKKKEDDKS